MRKKIAVLLTALLLVLLCAWAATANATTVVEPKAQAYDFPLCQAGDGKWKDIDTFEVYAVEGVTYMTADGRALQPGVKYLARDYSIYWVENWTQVRVYLEVATGVTLSYGSYNLDEQGKPYHLLIFENVRGSSCASYEPKPPVVNKVLVAKKPPRSGHVITIPAYPSDIPVWYSLRDAYWSPMSTLVGGHKIAISPGRTVRICLETEAGYHFKGPGGGLTVKQCWKYSRAASFRSPKGKVDAKKATVTLSLRMPGSGKVRVSGGKVKTITKKVGPSGKRTVTIKAKKAIIKKLRKQLRAHPKRKVATTRARVKITWYPKSGSRQVTYKTYTLKLRRK